MKMRFPKLALKEDLIIQYPSIETHRTDPKGGVLFRSPKKNTSPLQNHKSVCLSRCSVLGSTCKKSFWRVDPQKEVFFIPKKYLSTTKIISYSASFSAEVHIALSLSLTC